MWFNIVLPSTSMSSKSLFPECLSTKFSYAVIILMRSIFPPLLFPLIRSCYYNRNVSLSRMCMSLFTQKFKMRVAQRVERCSCVCDVEGQIQRFTCNIWWRVHIVSSLLCSPLQPPVTLSHLGPDIVLITPSSSTHLWSLLNMTDQVLHTFQL